MRNLSFTKKCLAFCLLAFPVLSILAFLLHFHSLSGFFHFTWTRPPYHAEGLFNALVSGRGHGFVVAHSFVYLAMPFLILTILVLTWYLLQVDQVLALVGAVLGIIGGLAMVGVIATWLSFAGVAHVDPQYYDGARAALVELTKMQGTLGLNTTLSYACFIGLIILSGGLIIRRQFPPLNMILIMVGSLLFILFMDMDNWMLIGTVLLGIGLIPVVKRLRS